MMRHKKQSDCGCGGGKHCVTKSKMAKLVKAELKRLDCGCGCKGITKFKKKYLTGRGILDDCPPGYRNDGLTCLEECKPGEVDDGLFCRDTNPPGPGWVNDGLTFRDTNPPGPDWVNDGLTFRNTKCPDGYVNDGLTCRRPIVTEVDDCPGGWRSDPITCVAPIQTELNPCPEGSNDVAGTCWGKQTNYSWGCRGDNPFIGPCGDREKSSTIDVITKGLADRGMRTWGGEIISRNPRTYGGEVVGQEIRGQEIRPQPTRGKDIKGRVNFDELMKEVDKGFADLISNDGALARAFDPEKNGVNDAFRKFGDDINRVLEDVNNRIKEGFKNMGEAAKGAFEQMGRDAEAKFKQFGDDFVAKMKDPDFWVEAIGIMAMIAGAALSLALTVGTLGIGAPAAAGIMAACAMAGPAARMIAAGARGEPIDALDIAEIVVAGATAAIPGMGPAIQTSMKVATTAASVTISIVKAGQGFGVIPSTCVTNCPPPPTYEPEPPIDPDLPPSSEPPPAGQLSDEEILALAPPCTFFRIIGKPHYAPPCNEPPVRTRNGPPFYSPENWIANYRKEKYGTNTEGPGGQLTTPEDQAVRDVVNVSTPTEPPIGGPGQEPIGDVGKSDLDIDLGEIEDVNLDLGGMEDLNLDLGEMEDLELDLGTEPVLDLDMGDEPVLDLDLGTEPILDLDLGTDEPLLNLDLGTEPAPTLDGGRKKRGGGSKSLTLYYANWCHFCKVLKPIWMKLRVPGVEIRMVEEKQNNELRVDGYPTIIYRNGSQIEKYSGPRTKSGIEKFLKNKL